MTCLTQRLAAACLSVVCATPAIAAEWLELPTRPGVTQGLYIDAPATAPSWVVMLFAGDDGDIGLSASGPQHMTGNFVLRTASYWINSGIATVLFDAPSDQSDGMDDPFRLSQEAEQDVASAVAETRRRYPGAKIALLGTSRGTITVGNALKRDPALANAYILTSPVTQAHGQQTGLSAMSWPGNKAHVLVVSNEHDGCWVSPFQAAKNMANDNGFDFIAESSEQAQGKKSCGSQSPHGYLGIETRTLDDIRAWLLKPAEAGHARLQSRP